MSKSKVEFEQFLSSSHSSMGEYELKLSRIILDNFRVIEGKSSAAGARATCISSLIQKYGDSVLPYESDVSGIAADTKRIQKICNFKVGGFRGFSEVIEFDLSKSYVFVYGPNGSGKSSFCEALEYSLTGKISEANSKRFELDSYIRNNSSTSSSVRLTVDYGNGEENANKNSIDNDFIFIEKNRIESFARVSSFTPQAQQARLSALFGLDQFNSFCNGFNKSIESKLPLNPVKLISLRSKDKDIEKYRLVIENKTKEIEGLETRKSLLLSKYKGCNLVSEVVEYLSPENDGLLKTKRDEFELLSKIQIKPIEKIDDLSKKVDLLESDFKKYTSLVHEIEKYRKEINFIDLYTAIEAISSSHQSDSNRCPACDTPVDSVDVNPYLKASTQLSILKEVSKKQNDTKALKSRIFGECIKLSSEVKSLGIEGEVSIDSFEEKVKSIKNTISSTKVSWVKSNSDNNILLSKKEELRKEITRLEKDYTESSTLSELYKAANKEKNNSSICIEKFNQENKTLIEQVEKEKKIIEFYLKYSIAYERIIDKLKTYSEFLPLRLAESLEKNVLNIYNSINKHPYDHEILTSLTLPKNPNQSISISYINGQKEDALRVLSEGHLRCLGLSILLAKNINDKHNVIVFDDVVNAIDDEHRGGFIRELFTNKDLLEKQIVLTTHGEEFVKRLENELPEKEVNRLLKRYDFLKNFDDRSILVEQNLNRHFLLKAGRDLKNGYLRDCLMGCRRSLEELSTKLWKKIGDEGLDSAITVKLRSPTSKPDLYNVIDGLIRYISGIEAKPGIKNFTKHKECLLEIKNASEKHAITWNLLNKGTHQEERDEEFDDNLVREILDLCITLEGLVKKYNRKEFSVA